VYNMKICYIYKIFIDFKMEILIFFFLLYFISSMSENNTESKDGPLSHIKIGNEFILK